MKKVLLFIAAAALTLSSCVKEQFAGADGNMETVSFGLALDNGVQTRADGDAPIADKLYYAVFDENDVLIAEFKATSQKVTEYPASVDIRLTKGQTYTVAFWAQNSLCEAYTVSDDMKITVSYADARNNDVTRDAFYGKTEKFTIGENFNKTVTLTRPFAQINAGVTTADFAAAVKTNFEVEQSSATISGVPTQLDVFTGVADVPADVTYSLAAIPNAYDPAAELAPALNVAGTNYMWLSMSYILADVSSTHDVTFTFKAADESKAPVVLADGLANIPVKRNWRTNIAGTLLTGNVQFEIKLDNNFADEIIPSYVADGVSLDALTQAYYISNVNGLKWLQAQVAGGENFSKKTFVLADDIDLAGEEWAPIGTSGKPFSGIFDGADHTVSNLKISGNNSNVGLFGMTTDGEVKNLTIENAEVSGRLNVGVVAGTPYTSKYTNIKVTGLVKVDGMSYVGAVGGKNAYADWTDVTVDVEEGSYVKANSVEDGTAYATYVGGVIGFTAEKDNGGFRAYKNITSNIDVIGSTCYVGGLVGIAHRGSHFINCSSSGNVEVTSADVDNAEFIGGLAGVWMNHSIADVKFDNCSFTGTLKTNVEGVDLSNNTITGEKYNKGSIDGKLIIDGVVSGWPIWNSGPETDADGNVKSMTHEEAIANAPEGYRVPTEAEADLMIKYGVSTQTETGWTIEFNGQTITLPYNMNDGYADHVYYWVADTTYCSPDYGDYGLAITDAESNGLEVGCYPYFGDAQGVIYVKK